MAKKKTNTVSIDLLKIEKTKREAPKYETSPLPIKDKKKTVSRNDNMWASVSLKEKDDVSLIKESLESDIVE